MVSNADSLSSSFVSVVGTRDGFLSAEHGNKIAVQA